MIDGVEMHDRSRPSSHGDRISHHRLALNFGEGIWLLEGNPLMNDFGCLAGLNVHELVGRSRDGVIFNVSDRVGGLETHTNILWLSHEFGLLREIWRLVRSNWDRSTDGCRRSHLWSGNVVIECRCAVSEFDLVLV